MVLRWYSVVVDCGDAAAQARWWGEALGWQVVETVKNRLHLDLAPHTSQDREAEPVGDAFAYYVRPGERSTGQDFVVGGSQGAAQRGECRSGG